MRRTDDAGSPDDRLDEPVEARVDDDAHADPSDSVQTVRRVVPWVLSAGIHAALIALGFFATWTVVQLTRDEAPVLILSDFDDVTYRPLAAMTEVEDEGDELYVQDRVETERVRDRFDEGLDADARPLDFGAARASAPAQFRPDPSHARATFVGLSSTNARRIVYVIDASGSMIPSFPIVVDELARSLDGLVPSQEFMVICFSGGKALLPPPGTRLVPGTEEEKLRVLAWLRSVTPELRSNPVEALKTALGFRPDAVFLLSTNITGSGVFEIEKEELLALLDEMNPIDPATGTRTAQINCIQFLDPDPLGTLEEIARRHGGGPEGGGGARAYRFLDRAELGLGAPGERGLKTPDQPGLDPPG